MKKLSDNKIAHVILILLLVGASLTGLVHLKTFVGYVGTELIAEAGTITTILIDDRRQTVFWAGVHGLVFSESGFTDPQTNVFDPGSVNSFTLVFDCFSLTEQTQELYASTSDTIDFDSLVPGTVEMIDDDFLNLSADRTDRTNNTFLVNESFFLGATNVTVPAVYTYVNSAPNVTWWTGILNDTSVAEGRLVMVMKAYTSSQPGYRGNQIRYQTLLPIPNSSTRWYFFGDPNDECPAGSAAGQLGNGSIIGFVFEAGSTTPIPNATVSAGGDQELTDSSGFFNLTVPGANTYNLISIKNGYITNITGGISVSIGGVTEQNLTMDFFFGYLNANSTVTGHVRDNTTGNPVPNATVTSGGIVVVTNESGNFSFNITAGPHVIASVATGYNNFVGNYSTINFQNLSYVINMTPFEEPGEVINGTPLNNGTIIGYAFDSSTGLPLGNVTVNINGITNGTDATGFYNLTLFEGTHNLLAVRTGFETFASAINITAFNTTEFNFSMTPTVQEAIANGSVRGYVFTDSGSPLEGASVFLIGYVNVSNSTGQYDFGIDNIPAGTHVIGASRTDYTNFFGLLNVTAGGVTEFNITMELFIESGLGPGQGVGQGPGQGSGAGPGLGPGRGPGTGFTSQVEVPIEITEYEISIKQIIHKLKRGTFISIPVTIKNHLLEDLDLRFSIEGPVRSMIQLDNDRIIVDAESDDELQVTILANQPPGIYEGALVISGDVDEVIPIYILVLEEERLAVETLLVKVNPLRERYTAGSELKFRVDLQNLLTDQSYKVGLSYILEGIENNESIFFEKEEVVIQTAYSLIKKFDLPPNMQNGNYKIKVKAEYLDFESEHFAIFRIGEPFYKYALFGILPLWILFLVMFILSTGTYGVLYIKKRAAAKKRFAIKLDYSKLFPAGPRSAYVGQIAETTNKTYFNLDFFQVHTLIAGSTGSGKSVAAQVLIEEALLKGTAVIVFDPTAQWTGFLRKSTDKKMMTLYRKFGMKKSDAQAFNGNIKSIKDAREIIEIKKYIKPGEIHVFAINRLDPSDADILVANTIRQVFKANLPESPQLKLLIVFDEVHRLLPKFGGSGQGFLQIERATREFRKWGVGLFLISQVLKDFVGETKANINTQVQMRTSDEGDLERIKEQFGASILQALVKAPPGTGMVENSEYNSGNPYFVSFRPLMHNTRRLVDEELDNYYKYNEMVDDLEDQIDQLEKEKVDVFDLRLELKLAQDKVKSGSFSMVDIYLEGLKPRLKAQWDKIGKKPKKRERKLVSENELKEELEKAKKELAKSKGGKGGAAAAPAAPTPPPAAEKKTEEPKEKKEGGGKEESKAGDEVAKESSKESPSAGGMPDAIKKAQLAKQSQGKTDQPAPAQEGESQVGTVIKTINAALDQGDRAKVVELQKQLQALYKTASNEDKRAIYTEFKVIQERFRKK